MHNGGERYAMAAPMFHLRAADRGAENMHGERKILFQFHRRLSDSFKHPGNGRTPLPESAAFRQCRHFRRFLQKNLMPRAGPLQLNFAAARRNCARQPFNQPGSGRVHLTYSGQIQADIALCTLFQRPHLAVNLTCRARRPSAGQKKSRRSARGFLINARRQIRDGIVLKICGLIQHAANLSLPSGACHLYLVHYPRFGELGRWQ